MKKAISIFIVLISIVLMSSSCEKNTAESVAERFAVAYHNLDFATAKSLATENSAKQLDLFAQMAEGMPMSEKDKAKKVIITMGTGKEFGDRASYFYTPSDNPVPQKINLIKVDGKWKVEWNKDTEIEANKKALEENDNTIKIETPQSEEGTIDIKIGDGNTE